MSLMSYNDAIESLLNALNPQLNIESVSLLDAHQRILAEDIIALVDAPLFDNSAMDGYAICGLHCESWRIVGEVSAGDKTQHIHLKEGEAVRIFTGAATPQGSDAVIAQEDITLTETSSEQYTISSSHSVKPQQHIRFKAEEYAQGAVLVKQGECLNAAMIGVAAGQGLTSLKCYKKLAVTVFSTGNELRPFGEELKENQIYDSNRFMLLSSLQNDKSYIGQDGGILPDDLDIIEKNLSEATEKSDAIIISGGASVGAKDFTRIALDKLGQVNFWKLAIKPGKPFGWGFINNTPIFILPGNPVASWVTFIILVLPALRKLIGVNSKHWHGKTIQASAQFNLPKAQGRQQYLRGTLEFDQGQVKAKIFDKQSSAMLATCTQTDALIIIPAHSTVELGKAVQVLCLNHI